MYHEIINEWILCHAHFSRNLKTSNVTLVSTGFLKEKCSLRKELSYGIKVAKLPVIFEVF